MERRTHGVATLGLCFVLLTALCGQNRIVAQAVAAGQTHACIFDHLALHTAPGTCRPRARVYPPQITGSARRAIYDSSLTFGVPYSVLLAIGRCESALDPRASNGTHFGLFQFAPSTFKRAVRRMRTETGVRAHSFWNPLDSAYAAGYLFAVGESPDWSCEHPPPQPPQ